MRRSIRALDCLGLDRAPLLGDDGPRLLRWITMSGVKSTVPAIRGRRRQITFASRAGAGGAALREVAAAIGCPVRARGGHSGGSRLTLRSRNYSWRVIRENAGFDVCGWYDRSGAPPGPP